MLIVKRVDFSVSHALKDTIAYCIFVLHFSKESFPRHRSSMSCKLIELLIRINKATLDFIFQKTLCDY